jgi:hypothetical protein
MPSSLRQEDTPFGSSTTATSVTSNALPSAALTGSVIEVWLALASGVVITSVIDSASQTYTLVGSVNDTTDTSFLACYALTNNASATALTVTANFSTSINPRNIHVREITGVKNQAADTSNFPARFQGTNGTDGLSVALTNASQPALISGVIATVSGSSTPVAGTGFTGTTKFQTGDAFGASLFQTKRITSTGSNPCTWTDATGGGTNFYLAGAVIWDESAVVAGSGPTILNRRNALYFI